MQIRGPALRSLPHEQANLHSGPRYSSVILSRAYRSSCSRFGAIEPDIHPHAVSPQKRLVLVTKRVDTSHTCTLPRLGLQGNSADSRRARASSSGIQLLRRKQAVARSNVAETFPIIPLDEIAMAAPVNALGYCGPAQGSDFLAQFDDC